MSEVLDVLGDELDITEETGDGVIGSPPGGLGDPLDITTRTACRCPDAHDTPDGVCDQFLPEPHGKNRIRCDGCQRDKGWIHKGQKVKRDRPPVEIKIQTAKAGRPPKLKEDQARVLKAAEAWLGMVAGVLEMSGDEVCAAAVKKGAPEVAMQLALLSEFHPIIVKILAPVEATGESLVWISLALAVSPIALVILTHHNLVSEQVAARIGIVTAMGAVIGQRPEEEAEAA